MNSHWIAERTIEALQRDHPTAALEVVSGGDVDRARVEAELPRDYGGFAYFGHGREHMLYRRKDETGEPIPVFVAEHMGMLGDRWFHAFACLSGHMLCRHAATAGAAAYLGYCQKVNVEWEVPQLPNALRALLEELVTVATLQLALGQRSRDAIRRRVRDASDRLLDWLDTHEEACRSIHWIQLVGLQSLANILHQKLDLEGAAVLP